MKVAKNPVTGKWEMVNPDASQHSAGAELIPCEKDSVLVVDDEEAIQRTFRNALSVYVPHVRVQHIGNGKAAVQLFRAGHHAVILMDYAMPGLNGELTYHEIHKVCVEKKWTMPAVIFFTGYNPPQALKTIVASDRKHCMIQKPVPNKTLVDVVQARLAMQA